VNPAWLDASLSKRFTTGRQPVVIKKRKTGLPVQNRLGIEERNTGIVEMCCQKTLTFATACRSVRLHVQNQLVVRVVFGIEHKPLLQQLQLVHKKHEENANQQGNKR